MTDIFALVTYKSSEASKIIMQLLLTFTLDFEDLLCRYKRKNFYELWTMAAAQVAENHQDEWRLTWYWWRRIYASILTWNYSQNLPAAAEALRLKISSYISEITTNTILISTGIVISYAMKQGIPFWIYWKVNGNWDSNMIRTNFGGFVQIFI